MTRFNSFIAILVFSTTFLGCSGDSEVLNDPLFQPADDIYQAAAAGDLQAVQAFMNQASWDPSVANYDGILPLCAAAQGGNVDIIWLMVQDGADVNLADHTQTTPLQYAKKAGHEEAVKYLMELGATE